MFPPKAVPNGIYISVRLFRGGKLFLQIRNITFCCYALFGKAGHGFPVGGVKLNIATDGLFRHALNFRKGSGGLFGNADFFLQAGKPLRLFFNLGPKSGQTHEGR